MLDAFTRASKSILAVLGQDAFLRHETTAVKVNIEHGVQYVDDKQLLVTRSIATIDNTANPRIDDHLAHPDGNFYLDGVYQRNGVNTRFVLRTA